MPQYPTIRLATRLLSWAAVWLLASRVAWAELPPAYPDAPSGMSSFESTSFPADDQRIHGDADPHGPVDMPSVWEEPEYQGPPPSRGCDSGWGCGGSPHRTGPGTCDRWRVGPVWDVAVDGMFWMRPDAELAALEAAAAFDLGGNPLPAAEVRDQFEHGVGGRLYVTGKLPTWANYRVQFGYAGIGAWNAAVVFPKIPGAVPPPPPPPPGAVPPPAERRSLHYRSSLHSAELNFLPSTASMWIPYWGVRYLRFDDEINDTIDQQASPPLAGNPPGQPSITTDRVHLIDIQNNLIGAQIGIRRDLWQCGHRFSVQGFANAGLYCNQAKRANLMTTRTTQVIADDTSTDTVNESRTDVSTGSSLSTSERSDVAYVSEVSLTGVMRFNKCVALRGGYQAAWIGGLRLADGDYLGQGLLSEDLFFHGWHAGLEYRR